MHLKGELTFFKEEILPRIPLLISEIRLLRHENTSRVKFAKHQQNHCEGNLARLITFHVAFFSEGFFLVHRDREVREEKKTLKS